MCVRCGMHYRHAIYFTTMSKEKYYCYRSIGVLFRERVSQFGDRTAIKYHEGDINCWKDMSWNSLKNNVDMVSSGLLTLGAKEHEFIGIYAANYHYWHMVDIASFGFRGVTIPVFATSSSAQIKYIVDETELKYLFVGDQEQYDNVLSFYKGSSIEKIIVFDERTDLKDCDIAIYFKDLLLLGDENIDDNLSLIDTYLDRASVDDIVTIIYTSGTTGEQKGVILKNSNFMFALYTHDRRIDVTPNDSSLAFLPMSHVYERSWSYYIMHSGAVNNFMISPRDVLDGMRIVKPTMMCTVPRFYEKVYDGIWEKVSGWSSIKQSIVKWAVVVGKRYAYRKKEGKKLFWLLQIKNLIANILVFNKIKKIFGGRLHMSACGGAALSPRIVEFFHAMGIFVNHGYGLTETTATVTCYKDLNYEYDSVGEHLDDVEVLINEDNEILVKGDLLFHGYYKKQKETDAVFDGGWFRTGDAGIFTDRGNLRITDRIKDIIKTSGGKYVAPQKLEGIFIQSKYIEQIAVIGNKRKYISALIVPAFEKIKEFAVENGIIYNSIKELVSNELINKLISVDIDKMSIDLAPFEHIGRFTLLDREFSIDSGELTATLKIRRKAINTIYKDQIDSMY